MMVSADGRALARACRFVGMLLCVFLADPRAEAVTIAPGQACTSAECHDRFGKEKSVHPAMEDGECSSCHEQEGEAHVFEFPVEGNELCYICHEQFDSKRNRHPALEDDCTTCHNPHQSRLQPLLEADSLSSLCFNCHDDSMMNREWAHGPVSLGECTACHDPHESDSSSLLDRAMPGLCVECHDDIGDAMGKDEVVHPPVEESCADCHSPHGGDRPFLLVEEVPGLCYGCHDDIEETVTGATVKHSAVGQGKSCLNCHRPHTSAREGLLRAGSAEICYGCHDKILDTPTGPIKDIKGLVKGNEYLHGPLWENDCTACHNPHGSKVFRLLRKAFPSQFFVPFSKEEYALCFSCHDEKIALFEKTTEFTEFRNGEQNLHYSHVNRMFNKCTACHDVHASDDPKHIRETSRLGHTEMPIRYEATDTGGSCNPGCHDSLGYDREKPIPRE